MTDCDITFLLTTGGHNAGIVSEPGHKGRSYQVMTTSSADRYADPDAWMAAAPRKESSWWPEWVAWLERRSGMPAELPRMGAPKAGYPTLADTPDSYVLQE